jgi:hypothetical protein
LPGASADGQGTRHSRFHLAVIDNGVAGMAFIATVVKSSAAKEKWVKFPDL